MTELIEAMMIASKYQTDRQRQFPTGCGHDVLWLNVNADDVSHEDLKRLEELSFSVDEEYAGALVSYRFGSC